MLGNNRLLYYCTQFETMLIILEKSYIASKRITKTKSQIEAIVGNNYLQ